MHRKQQRVLESAKWWSPTLTLLLVRRGGWVPTLGRIWVPKSTYIGRGWWRGVVQFITGWSECLSFPHCQFTGSLDPDIFPEIFRSAIIGTYDWEKGLLTSKTSATRAPMPRLLWLIQALFLFFFFFFFFFFFWVSKEILPIAQDSKYLGMINESFLFIMTMYVVCTHKNRLVEAILMSPNSMPLFYRRP